MNSPEAVTTQLHVQFSIALSLIGLYSQVTIHHVRYLYRRHVLQLCKACEVVALSRILYRENKGSHTIWPTW